MSEAGSNGSDPSEMWGKVDTAMNFLSVVVKERRLDEVGLSTLIEWEKTIRDELKDAAREQRLAKKANRQLKRRSPNTTTERNIIKEIKIKARADRKIEQAVTHMWRLNNPGFRRHHPIENTTLDSAMHAMQELNNTIMNRPGKELQEDDLFSIEKVGHNLATTAIYSNGFAEDMRVDEVPGVMTRFYLFSSDALEVRLHMFPALAETYIHNHKNNFASMCLYGCYRHTIWSVSKDSGDRHYEYTRDGNGKLSSPKEVEGGLITANSFTHDMNKVFFLSKEAHHTVEECSDGSLLNGTLTLYVKGKGSTFQTTVLSDEASLAVEEDAFDIEIEGDKKASVLSRMTAMLRLAAADHLRTTL
eukprot:TRINITY_DN9421_c0_g1_i1.p1 TRINITY_DN9421_c0_g1~~TRINITY_DN9421_c0_g1_i1.p1  ORF type:complete len:380 (+),score=79.30 TRINITY_DN9421_c0_g1_i1:61-1140(+)